MSIFRKEVVSKSTLFRTTEKQVKIVSKSMEKHL